MRERGRFIVLEGIDGSGTTTQAARLRDLLLARGREVLLTCEPTPGPVGSLIRSALQRKLVREGDGSAVSFGWSTFALLFAADRLDHVDSVIIPALEAGKVVVSDRYDLSSLIYQSETSPEGTGVLPWVRELNSRAARPDVVVVIDMDADRAAERRSRRGGEQELFEELGLQRRLSAAYARAEQLLPGDRVVHVSGEGTVEDVSSRILEVVDPLLRP